MDHENERDQLVRAAWTILGRTDFAGFKVQRVAAHAGLSTRAFYRHFTDKDHLLLVLVLDEMLRAAERLRQTRSDRRFLDLAIGGVGGKHRDGGGEKNQEG